MHFLYLCVSVCVCVYVYLFRSYSLTLSLSLSLSLSHSHSHSLSLSVYFWRFLHFQQFISKYTAKKRIKEELFLHAKESSLKFYLLNYLSFHHTIKLCPQHLSSKFFTPHWIILATSVPLPTLKMVTQSSIQSTSESPTYR